jgi:hypothetical protein
MWSISEYNLYIYIIYILFVCLTGYRLGPWRSYGYETGIIRTSMTWGCDHRPSYRKKATPLVYYIARVLLHVQRTGSLSSIVIMFVVFEFVTNFILKWNQLNPNQLKSNGMLCCSFDSSWISFLITRNSIQLIFCQKFIYSFDNMCLERNSDSKKRSHQIFRFWSQKCLKIDQGFDHNSTTKQNLQIKKVVVPQFWNGYKN